MDARVSRYFKDAAAPRREMLLALHGLILDLFPEARVDMRYRMPTYHHGDGWVAIANQKNYVSLYTCSARHIEAFKAQHPEIKSGKGCLNFRETDPLPADDLKRVVEHAIRQPE